MSSSVSTPSTSLPLRASSVASEPPKRPRPITAIEVAAFPRIRRRLKNVLLSNDRTLLG